MSESIGELVELELSKEIENILSDYDLYYHDVNVRGGYYEGLYIDIKRKYYELDEYKEVKRSINELRDFLLECVNLGLVAYCAGWCTSYSNKEESIKLIQNAINKELNDFIFEFKEGLDYLQLDR